MAEIALTKGYVATVDDADLVWLAQWKWYAHGTGRPYAARRTSKADGFRIVWMHRVLVGDPPGLLVDHVNRDPLDNRRANLRSATRHQNHQNTVPRNAAKSGFRGVCRCQRPASTWEARICADGRRLYIGRAATPEAAAHLYDAAARRLHGDFAILNFPEEAAA